MRDRIDLGRHRGLGTGSATVELVVLVPVLLLFVLVIAGFGRSEVALGGVTQAARAAADAAAVAPSAAEARHLAAAAATPVLSGATCEHPGVALDTSDFEAGGTVRVTVTCDVTFADLGVPGFPGERTVHASAVAPIDPYRSVAS